MFFSFRTLRMFAFLQFRLLATALCSRFDCTAPYSAQPRLTFVSVMDDAGDTINGEINSMNLRAGNKKLLRARPTHKGKPAKYQIGTAKLDNQLPVDFFKVIHNPTGANELEVLVIALEETGEEVLPAVGTVAVEVDGDPTEGVRTLRAESAVNWIPFGASTFAFDEGTEETATAEELEVVDAGEGDGEGDGESDGANNPPEGGD